METSECNKDWLFGGGLAVGILFLLVGIFSLIQRDIGTAEARLILCSGIGIIFGAFGSTAVIKYKGITITGVAAVAIILLYVIVSLTRTQATFGTISGDIKGAQIEIKGDQSYLGAIRDRKYEFVVTGNELKRSVFDLYICFPADAEGQGEQEVNFERIDKKYIEKFLGTDKLIEWHFDRDEQKLTEIATGTIIYQQQLPFHSSNFSTSNTQKWFFINEAHAEESLRTLDELFSDLGSGSASIRRAAREELALHGVRAIKPMMDQFRSRNDIYRIHLGILVALTEILRNDKSLNRDISNELTAENISLIVNSLDNDDRTIRIYAGEFLYDLGDPRVVKPALSLAYSSSVSSEGLYFSIFVIKGAFNRLPSLEKQNSAKSLNKIYLSAGTKTKQLIESFVSVSQ